MWLERPLKCCSYLLMRDLLLSLLKFYGDIYAEGSPWVLNCLGAVCTEISGRLLSRSFCWVYGALTWPFLITKLLSMGSSAPASLCTDCFHWELPCFLSIFLRQSAMPPGGLKCLALFYIAASCSIISWLNGDCALKLTGCTGWVG